MEKKHYLSRWSGLEEGNFNIQEGSLAQGLGLQRTKGKVCSRGGHFNIQEGNLAPGMRFNMQEGSLAPGMGVTSYRVSLNYNLQKIV